MLTLKEKMILISEKLICSPKQNILIIPPFSLHIHVIIHFKDPICTAKSMVLFL